MDGPIRLFTDDEIPQPRLRRSLVDLIGGDIEQIGLHADALAARQTTMAPALGDERGAAVAIATGQIADELGRQSGGFDSSIGDVAAGVDGMDGELAGLSNEVGRDLGVPEPQPPRIPPGSDDYVPPKETPDRQEPAEQT